MSTSSNGINRPIVAIRYSPSSAWEVVIENLPGKVKKLIASSYGLYIEVSLKSWEFIPWEDVADLANDSDNTEEDRLQFDVLQSLLDRILMPPVVAELPDAPCAECGVSGGHYITCSQVF